MSIERICKNCLLFNPQKSECSVVILHDGKRIKLPVDEKDPCFFEQEYIDPITGQKDNFNDIQQVKFWVENPNTGEKTDHGIVKMEYPEGFFGDTP